MKRHETVRVVAGITANSPHLRIVAIFDDSDTSGPWRGLPDYGILLEYRACGHKFSLRGLASEGWGRRADDGPLFARGCPACAGALDDEHVVEGSVFPVSATAALIAERTDA